MAAPRGPLKGPRGPLKGPRGPLKGPRGPLKGPRGPFKGGCNLAGNLNLNLSFEVFLHFQAELGPKTPLNGSSSKMVQNGSKISPGNNSTAIWWPFSGPSRPPQARGTCLERQPLPQSVASSPCLMRGCTLKGNVKLLQGRKSVILGVWAAPGASVAISLGRGALPPPF